jgi:hypothetical protein
LVIQGIGVSSQVPQNYSVFVEFLTAMSNKSHNLWCKASFLTPFFDFGGFAVNVFFEVCCGNFDAEKSKRRSPVWLSAICLLPVCKRPKMGGRRLRGLLG